MWEGCSYMYKQNRAGARRTRASCECLKEEDEDEQPRRAKFLRLICHRA